LPHRGFRSELIQGDLLDPASLDSAFRDVDVAYYLVHSMNDGAGFERLELRCAENFAKAAKNAGVKRIVYLGGLAHGSNLSPHMRSRAEVGDVLRSSGIPVLEFRASVVIGSGSASFDMIRSLVETLPVMVIPRWVREQAQPIAIEDVISYLLEARNVPLKESRIAEIGGRDVTSYMGIMQEYARQRGLKRTFLPVPFLSLSLSSRWLTLFTPLYARIGKYLIESVRHPSVVRTPAHDLFHVRPMGIRDAISRAFENEQSALPESRWSDALGGSPKQMASPAQSTLRNVQTITIPLGSEFAFAPIRRIGGETGWYFGNLLWRIRGLLDVLAGGVGMRRGRPDPETPLIGSTLDFWRVEDYVPGRRLRLIAEMKVPGSASLEFTAEPRGPKTVIRQVAQFQTSSLLGKLYWYALWPVHEIMFRGMLREIRAVALQRANQLTMLPTAS